MPDIRPLARKSTEPPVIEPRTAARLWLEAGQPVAIATVVETWGSAPVRAGGIMAIAGEEEFQGSVSGGCVEADVIAAALDTIETGNPELLSFGISDEMAWRAGLACGGQIKVHVVRLQPDTDLSFMRALDAGVEKRIPMVIRTRLADGTRDVFTPDTDTSGDAGVAEALANGQSRLINRSEGLYFVQAIVPAPRLAIVGATHIGQHLATMALAAGYDVKVIDPREAFASPARFSSAHTVTAWPDEVMADLASDTFSAVVTLTHVDHIDDDALTIALRSPCRYIGSLGSRRTHAKRVERLRAAGFTEADIARIHAPVGLNIGAETPGEIAASILGEVIQSFRKPKATDAKTADTKTAETKAS